MEGTSDLAKIYQEFREPLKGFIAKRISDDGSAEDILHDVFIRIHNQIGSLKESDKLTRWIYSIARNAVIDFYRRKRDTTDVVDDLPVEEPSATDISDRVVPMVRSMINKLPDIYKEALLLADLEGLTQAEVASRLGISLSGAKSRVQRGRKMLKEMLLECCHFEFDRYGTVFDYSPRKCQCCDSSNRC